MVFLHKNIIYFNSEILVMEMYSFVSLLEEEVDCFSLLSSTHTEPPRKAQSIKIKQFQ